MTSASIPPTRKNPNAVKKYSSPMRLWSVVVSQLFISGSADRPPGPRCRRAAPAVREVRPDPPTRGALDGMTADARRAPVDRPTLLGEAARRRSHGRAQLGLRPRAEPRVAVDDHAQPHVPVRGAAELRALTRVLTDRVGAERDVVRLARDGVALTAEPRDPKRVDHVGRRDGDAHGLTDREVQLVGGREAEVQVLELPPPLVADHPDFDRVGGGSPRGREDRPDRGHRHEHEDRGRREGPGDLHQGVAVRRLGSGPPFAVAEPDQGDDEQRFDHDEHGGRPPEDVGEQHVGGAREIGAGVERRLRKRTAAPRQGERGGQKPESESHGWDTSTTRRTRQRTGVTSNSPSNPPTELPPTNTRNFPGSTTNFMSLL